MRWSFRLGNQGERFAGERHPYIIGGMTKPDPVARDAVPNAAVPVADSTTGAGTGAAVDAGKASRRPREIGGPSGPEPTRYGDWERNGRVSDF
jgi:hypothetical protein